MSNQPKHSPGPWFWDDEEAMPWADYDETIYAPFLVDANGRAVMSGDNIRIRNESDGQLMIAAPDLLESLKDMISLMSNGCGELARLPFTWREAFDKAEAAIAKAEGRGE